MQCPFCHAETADSERCCPSCGQYFGIPEMNAFNTQKLRTLIRQDAERTGSLNSNSRQAASNGEKKIVLKFVLAILALNLIAALVFYFAVLRSLGKFNQAKALFDAGSYSDAAVLFDELGSYRNSSELAENCRESELQTKYDAAAALLNEGNYPAAIQAYSELGSYRDAAECVMRIKKKLVNSIVPVYQWDFTSSLDVRRGELNQTICGDVALTPPDAGGYAQVASFDGDGDYIDCGRELNLTGDWALSVTFYAEDVTKRYEGLFTKYETSGAGPYALSICEECVDFLVTAADGTQTEIQSAMHIAPQKWYHALVQRKGDTISLYINGMLHGQASVSGELISNQDTVTIGRQALLHSPDQLQFRGQMANVTVYDLTLSDSEIKFLSEVNLANAGS